MPLPGLEQPFSAQETPLCRSFPQERQDFSRSPTWDCLKLIQKITLRSLLANGKKKVSRGEDLAIRMSIGTTVSRTAKG